MINHIIIPVVESRHNLEEQNVFKHSYLSFTPQKANLPEPILWKKSMSAFKKFKQKKDKKDKKIPLHTPDESFSPQEKFPGKVKLITRSHYSLYNLQNWEQNQLLEQCFTTLIYYDPNEAPLYQFNANDTVHSVTVKQSKNVSKNEQFLTNQADCRMPKLEAQLMEEENPILFSVEPRPDDPFFIVRKGTIKKSLKFVKSKSIKKQKWEKGCTKDEQEEHNPNKKKIELLSSNLNYDQKMSDKESSEDELLNKNRQIFTLSQIMRSAQEQRADEDSKTFRAKENVTRQLKFEQSNK